MPTSIGTIPVASLPASGAGGEVSFRIPAYQRGYRWKKDDVTKLLYDLKEFMEGKRDGRPFYCLQPLVVKKSNDCQNKECWEVVDGQQRLTTLYLVWKFLNGHPPYELSYETRERSKDFLSEIARKTPSDITNIDFHHIYHAYQTVKGWFHEDEERKSQFRTLLNDPQADGRNVRFIWYRLQEDDDSVAAFTRLNVGKIPLRDEELIRALFLSSAGTDKLADGAFQHRLALEWDRMENSLQEPDFWGFLSNETPPEGGRIRLLFQLCAPENVKNDNHALFEHYQDRLSGEHPDRRRLVWQDLVTCFEQLEEWYRDPEHFHLVGYRATILGNGIGTTLRKLLGDAKSTTKADFAIKIRQSIRKELMGKEDVSISDFVSGLSYSTSLKTRQTLALFNIATILRTKGVRIRFPFHLYHDTKFGWDIEHIQSQAGDGLGDKKRQMQWLESCRPEIAYDAKSQATAGDHNDDSGEISPHALLTAIDAFLNSSSKQEFSELEKKIRTYFNENDAGEDVVNSVGNLTLLDAPTNRGYGNSPFAVKRAEILKPERPEGTFILPCTRDLFLKVFSEKPGNLRRWDIGNDGAAHEAAICETIENFFENRGGITA